MRASARNVIVLLGLRASGKTSVGRKLADRLGLPFLDLDEELPRAARRAGVCVASAGELLATRGEREFRALEADCLRRILEPGPRLVLASGGGVVERADNRAWLARAARCVLLRATPEVLAARRALDPTSRPALLGSDARTEAELLWRRRAAHYRALAEFELESGEEAPEVLARRLEELLGAPRIPLRGAAESPDLHG